MPTAFCYYFSSCLYKYSIPLGLREINPVRDEIFIDVLLIKVNKIPLGMTYNDLIFSTIKRTEPIFILKYSKWESIDYLIDSRPIGMRMTFS